MPERRLMRIFLRVPEQTERHQAAAKNGQRSPSSKFRLARGRNFVAG